MFCPLIKQECAKDCIFKNDDYTCGLLKSIKDIEINTGSDQTESYWINSKLGDISDKLERIIKHLEHIAD